MDPEWAVQPPSDYEWTLVEIKSGVELARHLLSDKANTILGRALGAVHIPIHHESASRQHARIAFDSMGIPWLKDLQSTHGTTVNKRTLPPIAIGRVESNSIETGARGVMLFPGDVLQFGASTRLFSVEGPTEYDRGAVQARLQQQKQQQPQPQKHTIKEHSDSTRSMGPSFNGTVATDNDGNDHSDDNDDHDDEYDDHGDHRNDGSGTTKKSLAMDIQVPDKHRKAFEKLNAMKYKLANLETEDGRIRRKGGDLTEGQEKQLQRNAEREETLKKSIVDLEGSLYDKLYPNSKSSDGSSRRQKEKSQSYVNDDDEEDDFFDRTKATNFTGTSDWIGSEAESEKSLITKWKALVKEYEDERTIILPPAQDDVDGLTSRIYRLQATGDEEAFFLNNDLLLAKETLKKIESSLNRKQRVLDGVEKLLKVVNETIRYDRKTGYIGNSPLPQPITSVQNKNTNPFAEQSSTSAPFDSMPPPPPLSTSRKVPTREKLLAEEEDQDRVVLLPPPTVIPSSGNSVFPPPLVKPSSATNNTDSSFELPAPKKQRVFGVSMPPPSSIKTTPPIFASSTLPIGGTRAILNSMNKSMDTARGDSGNQSGKQKEAPPTPSQKVVDLKQDVWRAPKGQDGSGYTKLNEKFAGRY
jgi:pSer/pThr/pTyr-binding forkhead associated (FHA) protein